MPEEKKGEEWVTLDYGTPSETAKKLMNYFDAHIVGQERAKERIVSKYETFKERLKNPEKPVALFFPGPTGVGKTWMIRTFARFLFGDFDAFTRIDCSEYQESHTISRLLGSPPGYVGSGGATYVEPLLSQWNIDKFGYQASISPEDKEKMESIKKRFEELRRELGFPGLDTSGQGGTVITLKDAEETKDILRKLNSVQGELKRLSAEYESAQKLHPYKPGAYPAVLLFDETEEMHPDIVKVLLQILDRGMLTLADGKAVKFNNCFIFLTSNIGSHKLANLLERKGVVGFQQTQRVEDLDKLIYRTVLEEIRKARHFPPKLIGRIGKENIIVFRVLKDEEIKKIIELQLDQAKEKIQKIRPMKITFSPSLKRYLFKETRDPINQTLGARPIEKIIETKVTEPFQNLMAKGNRDGIIEGDTVVIAVERNKVVIRKAQRKTHSE